MLQLIFCHFSRNIHIKLSSTGLYVKIHELCAVCCVHLSEAFHFGIIGIQIYRPCNLIYVQKCGNLIYLFVGKLFSVNSCHTPIAMVDFERANLWFGLCAFQCKVSPPIESNTVNVFENRFNYVYEFIYIPAISDVLVWPVASATMVVVANVQRFCRFRAGFRVW